MSCLDCDFIVRLIDVICIEIAFVMAVALLEPADDWVTIRSVNEISTWCRVRLILDGGKLEPIRLYRSNDCCVRRERRVHFTKQR